MSFFFFVGCAGFAVSTGGAPPAADTCVGACGGGAFGGYLSDALKYLDHAGADQWCELLKHSRFLTEVSPLPMPELVATIHNELDGMPFDLLGIGAGTAAHELTLTARLLGRRRAVHDASTILLTPGYEPFRLWHKLQSTLGLG